MMQELLLNVLKPLASMVCGLGKQKKMLILVYHRVLDQPDYMRPDVVDKVAFTWQMKLLSKYFNVLPLSEGLQRVQDNTLPSRAVCITFDDGYADNFTNALPILKQFNLPATFFVANGFLDGGRMWNDTVIEAVRNAHSPVLELNEIGLGQIEVTNDDQRYRAAGQIIRHIKHLSFELRTKYTDFIATQSQSLPGDLMMSSEQLKKLYQSGMEIGGHTVNHPILAKLDETEARRQIDENKIALENILETKLNIFAYPNGKPGQDYYDFQVDLVRLAGYSAAVSTQWGVVNKSSDFWQLPRFTPWDRSPVKFMLRIIYLFGINN